MIRGDVYRVRLPDARGHERRGRRLAVVVQADELLGLSTVIVAPTSTAARPASFRPPIEVDGTVTRVLVEQMRAVDATRLVERAGHLSAAEQRAVDECVELVLGLT